MSDFLKMTDQQLDERLNSQAAIRDAVKSLPEEFVSLQWRSDLNERLRTCAPERRRQSWFFHAWKPALGLMAAGCLAMVVTVRVAVEEQPIQSGPGLEASLVGNYREIAVSRELAGTGLSHYELEATGGALEPEWSEADFEAL
jgi:hypothetical protein